MKNLKKYIALSFLMSSSLVSASSFSYEIGAENKNDLYKDYYECTFRKNNLIDILSAGTFKRESVIDFFNDKVDHSNTVDISKIDYYTKEEVVLKNCKNSTYNGLVKAKEATKKQEVGVKILSSGFYYDEEFIVFDSLISISKVITDIEINYDEKDFHFSLYHFDANLNNGDKITIYFSDKEAAEKVKLSIIKSL